MASLNMVNRAAFLGLLAVNSLLAITDASLPAGLVTPLNKNQAVLGSPGPIFTPTQYEIISNRTLRSYWMQLPYNHHVDSSRKWPLIVDFHGRNGSALGQWNNSQYFMNPYGREYFVVYPLGCNGTNNETAWEGAPYANPLCNDTLFTSDLVGYINATYNIDSERIFASGKSNGGGFVDTLACSTTGDMFAAFAMSAAALYTDTFTAPVNCLGTRPRRIIEAHGINDTTIPIDGRRSKDTATPNINRWMGRWAERNWNGCHPDEARKVQVEDWGNLTSYSCNAGQDMFLQQYRIKDLDHCWPSVVSNTDSAKHNTAAHPNACPVPNVDFTQTVMDFFSAGS